MRKFASWAKRGLFALSPLALLAAMAASAAGPGEPPASVREVRELRQVPCEVVTVVPDDHVGSAPLPGTTRVLTEQEYDEALARARVAPAIRPIS